MSGEGCNFILLILSHLARSPFLPFMCELCAHMGARLAAEFLMAERTELNLKAPESGRNRKARRRLPTELGEREEEEEGIFHIFGSKAGEIAGKS